VQAKTTKKIVLRLQCNVCKAVHMHAIKVRRFQTRKLRLPLARTLLVQSMRGLAPVLILDVRMCSGASTSRLVARRSTSRRCTEHVALLPLLRVQDSMCKTAL
jgi:hypothetical protein